MRALLIASFLLVACSNEEEIKKKVAAVQQQADDQASKAKQEAQQKADDLQKQIDQLKADAADSKTKLDDCTSKVQTSTDASGKSAEAALAAARSAFKEEGHLELANANKALSELGPKSVKASAKAKAAFQKALQPVSGQQKTIAADLAAWDTATLDSFKSIKGKFEHDLGVLKNAIRAAKATLPP
jgi:predicted phage tail protein